MAYMASRREAQNHPSIEIATESESGDRVDEPDGGPVPTQRSGSASSKLVHTVEDDAIEARTSSAPTNKTCVLATPAHLWSIAGTVRATSTVPLTPPTAAGTVLMPPLAPAATTLMAPLASASTRPTIAGREAATASRAVAPTVSMAPMLDVIDHEADITIPTNTVSFEVEVVEDRTSSSRMRYRDAVRLPDEQVLLIMTDFAGNPVLSSALLSRWKDVVRKAGARGKGPDAVLQAMNAVLAEADLQATASCARLDVRERFIAVACAGAAPPFVLRSGNRVVRVHAAPSVALGRVRAAQFVERCLHFDRGDMLLLPSACWMGPLEGLLDPPPPPNFRVPEWLRQKRVQPVGGSLLRLALL